MLRDDVVEIETTEIDRRTNGPKDNIGKTLKKIKDVGSQSG